MLSSDDEERTQELEEHAAPMEDKSEKPDLQSQIHALKEEMEKVCGNDEWRVFGSQRIERDGRSEELNDDARLQMKSLLVMHDDQLRDLPGYAMT